MFRYAVVTLWVLVFAVIAAGQDLTIKGDTKVVEVERQIVIKEKMTVVNALPFTVSAPAGGALYQWTFPANITANKLANVLTITAAPKGELTVAAEWIVIDFDKRTILTQAAKLTFAVGDVTPPVPPDPIPPAPIKIIAVDGNAVLMVFETDSGIVKGTAEQKNWMYSQNTASFLNRKCSTDPERNDWKAWRQLNKTTDMSGAGKVWQDAMTRAKSKMTESPWLMISTNKGSFEGPLPKTAADSDKLMKQYLGD